MNAILSITGSVKAVDPQGYILVAGIAFSVGPSQLPRKGQIVKIEAHLAKPPQSADEQPIWTTSSIIAFDMPDAAPATATAPQAAVPHRTDHHNPIAATPAAKVETAPAAAQAPAGGRFGTTPTRTASTKETAAPSSAAAIANQAVSSAATSSRFQRPVTPAPARRFPGASTPASSPSRAPAPTAQARPPFVSTTDDLDDDVPF